MIDNGMIIQYQLKKEFKSSQGKFPPFPRKTVFKAQRGTIEKRTALFVDFFKFILEKPVLCKHATTQEFIKPRVLPPLPLSVRFKHTLTSFYLCRNKY